MHIDYRLPITPLEREIAHEQVTHPTHLYQPGSERLEKLYQAMREAQRFTWPSSVETI